ncbi:natural resistance-associated macrophage protein [Arthrobacter sp. Hiyo8]|nr:natural resistance-associated macrophage protein [Arthrobacter sp. Hiyo8]GAP61226.1 natural resistance-associated macrophage protein [Arthrobacter sp. Hiyo1]
MAMVRLTDPVECQMENRRSRVALDLSGIATYAQVGAAFSNAMLRTAPLTLPMMMAVQEICDRTALATGDILGRLARRKVLSWAERGNERKDHSEHERLVPARIQT